MFEVSAGHLAPWAMVDDNPNDITTRFLIAKIRQGEISWAVWSVLITVSFVLYSFTCELVCNQ